MDAVAEHSEGQSEPPRSELQLPVMPHLVHDTDQLDKMYPPIKAPTDNQLDDMENDNHDKVLQKGLQIADGIRDALATTGRTRRREPLGGVFNSMLCVGGHSQETRQVQVNAHGLGIVSPPAGSCRSVPRCNHLERETAERLDVAYLSLDSTQSSRRNQGFDGSLAVTDNDQEQMFTTF